MLPLFFLLRKQKIYEKVCAWEGRCGGYTVPCKKPERNWTAVCRGYSLDDSVAGFNPAPSHTKTKHGEQKKCQADHWITFTAALKTLRGR